MTASTNSSAYRRARRFNISTICFARIHPDDVESVRNAYERCRREGIDFHCEYRVPLAGGRLRWVYDRGTMFRTPDAAYMTGAATDITDQKQIEGERERLRDENARANSGAKQPLPKSGRVASTRMKKSLSAALLRPSVWTGM